MNTIEKLEKLADLMDHKDFLAISKKEMIDALIPAEVKIQMKEIDVEFGEKEMLLQEQIEKLSVEVKQDVVTLGTTAKSKYLMAVYNKGRETWDSGKLDGMAVLIPDILKAKKVGEPSVTFRRNG